MNNEFKEIVEEYNNKLIMIFKNIISKAANEAIENEMDAIETFIYINEELENGFERLANAKGEIYIRDTFQMPVDEKIYIELFDYIDSYLDDAINEFKELVNDVLNSNSIEELKEKQNKLRKVLNTSVICQYKDLFEVEIPKLMQKRLK